MYLYPMYFTDELIDDDRRLAEDRAVSRHAAAAHQRRRCSSGCSAASTAAQTDELVDKLRERIPNLVLRTTFITGFPGETDEQFEELCEFVARDAVRAAGRLHLFVRARHAGRQARRASAGRGQRTRAATS